MRKQTKKSVSAVLRAKKNTSTLVSVRGALPWKSPSSRERREPPSPRLGSGRLRLQSWPCRLPTCCADLGRFLAVSDPRPWSEVR